MGVLIQNLTDAEGLLGGLCSVNDGRGQSEQLPRVCIKGMLLRDRPYSAANQQTTQRYCVGSRAHRRLERRSKLWRWCIQRSK
jgi:hypothetical protein